MQTEGYTLTLLLSEVNLLVARKKGRLRDMETQRRPGSTGADGPPFAAPGTHGKLKGPGVSWGSGRRWVLPCRVGVKGSDGAQAPGPVWRGPHVPDG